MKTKYKSNEFEITAALAINSAIVNQGPIFDLTEAKGLLTLVYLLLKSNLVRRDYDSDY